MLGSKAGVDRAAASVVEAGGTLLKGPFATYYGQWQAVAVDPEGGVFRLAAEALPGGVDAPSLASLLPMA